MSSDRVFGSILAGAVGDALGGAVEFLSIADIRKRFGPQGIVRYEWSYGGLGRITDDTQLTMFTMEGLIRARRSDAGLVPVLQHAYQRWLHTQGVPWDRAVGVFAERGGPDGALIQEPDLFHRRAPGNTVLGALTAFAGGAPSPAPERPANDSKGCGAVMRAAPFAVWSADPAEAFRAAAVCGALTHGHPSGYLSAGALAVIVQQLAGGAELTGAVATARGVLAAWPGYEETDRALAGALELAAAGRPSPEAIAGRLGGGWVGEEALAIGLCAALVATDLDDGLRLAVNHSGDSDSTGAICGNILGARDGMQAISSGWLDELELRDVIEWLTEDLLGLTVDRAERYPPW